MKLPDKTTKSLVVRPKAAKFCFKVAMSANGDGIRALASEARDTLPSLRPVGTSHHGPLICQGIKVLVSHITK